MIKSYADRDTEELFRGGEPKRLRPIVAVAKRKLDMLDYATEIRDLSRPPGNRLEALKGDRRGQFSIRINDRWRICFRWRGGPIDVEIVDYH